APLAPILDNALDDAREAAPRQAGEIGRVGGEAEHEVRMVLQVLADSRQMMRGGDAVFSQRRRVADARQHQELRRLERAGGQDHLAPRADDFLLLALDKFDADRALALEQNARALRACLDLEIRAARHERMDIAARRAPALAVLLRELVGAEPLLLGAVEIVADAQLRLARALQEHLAHRIVR